MYPGHPERQSCEHTTGDPSGSSTPWHPQLVLVGERHFNAFGSHGSIDHVKLGYYPTLEECCSDLKQNKGDLPRLDVQGTVCAQWLLRGVPQY